MHEHTRVCQSGILHYFPHNVLLPDISLHAFTFHFPFNLPQRQQILVVICETSRNFGVVLPSGAAQPQYLGALKPLISVNQPVECLKN